MRKIGEFMTTQELLQEILDLEKAIIDIKLNLQFHKESPFKLNWERTNSTIILGLNQELSAKWKQKKQKMAKEFLKLAETQLKIFKAELKQRI